jgi:hypothetical protein
MARTLRQWLSFLRANARAGIVETLFYRLDGPPASLPPDRGVSLAVLLASGIGTLAEIGAADLELARERFARGDLCYVANLGGVPVHHSWVQRSGIHPIDDAGLETRVRERECWIYNCHTTAAARGRRIYPLVLSRIVEDLRGAGVRTAGIYTTRSNVPSQKGIERAGFHTVFAARAVRLGPWHVPLSGRASVEDRA